MICQPEHPCIVRLAVASRHFHVLGKNPRSFTPKRSVIIALAAKHLSPSQRRQLRNTAPTSTPAQRRAERLAELEREVLIVTLPSIDPAKTCLACQQPITPGTEYAAAYDQATRTRCEYHPDCQP